MQHPVNPPLRSEARLPLPSSETGAIAGRRPIKLHETMAQRGRSTGSGALFRKSPNACRSQGLLAGVGERRVI